MTNYEANPDTPDATLGIGNRQSAIGDPRLAAIWNALESVTDPEIPVLSVVDMGIVADVRVEEDSVAVDMTPTFVGCPAVDVMRSAIHDAVAALGERNVAVNVVFDPPWTSDRITEKGRERLLAFGLAPPKREGTRGLRDGGTQKSRAGSARRSFVPLDVGRLERVACPFCHSTNTTMESMFGPTLCRSIHYCNDCLQSFEHFKNV